jgi:hypothetical protein
MLTLAQASAIVDHALAYARANNMAPMTIAVLDARLYRGVEDGGRLRADAAGDRITSQACNDQHGGRQDGADDTEPANDSGHYCSP